MKYISFIILFIGTFSSVAYAQPDSDRRNENVRNLRIAIYTEVLQFTPEEAQGFWPVYNEYLDKREALVQQYKPTKQLDAMSDAEVEEEIQRHFERQQRELELEKEVVQKLRRVLPLRKIAKLPVAERQFRESILKKLQEAREQRQDRRLDRRLPGGNRR